MARLKKVTSEAELYDPVEKWLSSSYCCFRTEKNVGLKYSRVDVIGIRDLAGDLDSEIEIIGVEVKKNMSSFASSCGQAYGYRAYLNRVYLAVLNENEFERAEIDIASHLGIGLIHISPSLRCREVLSSPYSMPIPGMALQVVERLALLRCQLCGIYFDGGESSKSFRDRTQNLSRQSFKRALENERGLIFWRHEVGERKMKKGVRSKSRDGLVFERRYFCPECVELLGEVSRAGASSQE